MFLAGDINCIDSLELDKAGGVYLDGDKGSVELKDFADSLSLCHVFRVKFHKRKLFPRHKSNTNMSWIDRIYAPKSMISDAFGYTFDPCSYSNHDLASVKFNCKWTFDHGPSLWTFNPCLTMDNEYTRLLSQFLQDCRLQKGRYPDLRTWWDMRQQKKEMTELKSHSGELLSDSKDIKKEMNDFYQDLFSEEEVDLEAQDWLLDQLSMSLCVLTGAGPM